MNSVGKVKLNDEIKSLKTEVAKLKSDGVEIIIALAHSGLDMDRRVAREVEGVDAVVGGHSHSYLVNGKSAKINTIIYLFLKLNTYVLHTTRVVRPTFQCYIFKISYCKIEKILLFSVTLIFLFSVILI